MISFIKKRKLKKRLDSQEFSEKEFKSNPEEHDRKQRELLNELCGTTDRQNKEQQ